MFQVSPDNERALLEKERATELQHTVAQLIFVTSRSRKYIKMAIDFLFTQVGIPEEDDWVNLVRVLRYIRGTLHIQIILRADSLSVIKWWFDESFDTHTDCKGHTGEMMSMVSGLIMELSRKKK